MTMTKVHPWLAEVRRGIEERADPERAAQMRAYMKSSMPYAGVGMPEAKRLFKEVFARYPEGTPSRRPFDDEARFFADVRAIWDGARVREERYAALELLTCARAKKVRTPNVVPLLRHVVVTGAWWDLVDWAAPKTLGPLLVTHPREAAKVVRAWAREDDIWLRRSAVLAQLHAKARTDTKLLEDALAPSLGDREFFLAKAIGWALREYAKTDEAWVRRYLEAHRERMAKLSVREDETHLA